MRTIAGRSSAVIARRSAQSLRQLLVVVAGRRAVVDLVGRDRIRGSPTASSAPAGSAPSPTGQSRMRSADSSKPIASNQRSIVWSFQRAAVRSSATAPSPRDVEQRIEQAVADAVVLLVAAHAHQFDAAVGLPADRTRRPACAASR